MNERKRERYKERERYIKRERKREKERERKGREREREREIVKLKSIQTSSCSETSELSLVVLDKTSTKIMTRKGDITKKVT